MKSDCELVRRGIDPRTEPKRNRVTIDICQNCTLDRCVMDYHRGVLIKPTNKKIKMQRFTSEYMRCPGCKWTETLNFSNGVLESTIKYYQNNGNVYHRCGTELPCVVIK